MNPVNHILERVKVTDVLSIILYVDCYVGHGRGVRVPFCEY